MRPERLRKALPIEHLMDIFAQLESIPSCRLHRLGSLIDDLRRTHMRDEREREGERFETTVAGPRSNYSETTLIMSLQKETTANISPTFAV